MRRITRRAFMKYSLAATAAALVPFSRARGANDDIRVAVVGLGGKGSQHVDVFAGLEGVRVVALCDVDSKRLRKQVEKFEKQGQKVTAYRDVRELLENKNIDAVVVATPNHWHALITVWACQAGKDVYVEKPVSHDIWEGRKAVEAARKYRRIVQAGTQNRSDVGLREAVEYMRQGNLGKILWIHALWFKHRLDIGRVDGPQPVPSYIDYNLWTGPAPLEPLRRKKLHYDWHWFWSTGNGEMGNLGAHVADDARRILGSNKLPERVMSVGGRFVYNDDAQTPNTHFGILDYKPAPIIVEMRNLPRERGSDAMDSYRGTRLGSVVHCEGGYFVGGRGGGWVYDNQGKKVKQFPGDGGRGHQANFIKAVRSRKVSDLHADIEQGHLSAALCHMINTSHRLGVESVPKQIAERIKANKEAVETFERFKAHLAANGVDLLERPAILGPWLKMDTERERFAGEWADRGANALVRRKYRAPFVLPDKV